ncbi:MAG TPA: hypothetical protein VM143_01505 [Acidimicrobiales bacterium]|nr:hypothetical protein [Acidimicrobiales bacterium]
MPSTEDRLRWIISALSDPNTVTIEELDEAYDPTEWRGWSPQRELEFFRTGRHSDSRPFTIETLTSVSESEANAVLLGADGKRWTVTCWTEDAERRRITGGRTMPAPPEGTTIRLAEPEDGPMLGALERRAPLRLGRDPLTLMSFDHGDDYFAPSRLMDEVTIYVAEVDGSVAGVYCGAVQPVLLDGEPKRLFLEHHVRIDPATARAGVFWALCNYGRDTYGRSTDSIAFYVSVDNHPVRKFVEGVPPWPIRPVRALLPCVGDEVASFHGPPTDDGQRSAAVEILNRCHAGSALFVPYTEASLDTRLARDPEQYGWRDLRVVDRAAVIGIGRQLLTVTKEREGDKVVTRRALALDHGFAPGHEHEYRALLVDTTRALAAHGATHLAVFTSATSATYGVVADLADEIEEFDFWAFDVPAPDDLQRGFYVDPVYF